MDDAAKARFVKIENRLAAFTEHLAAAKVGAERRQAEWERGQAEREKARRERGVARLARAPLHRRTSAGVRLRTLDNLVLRLNEVNSKLDTLLAFKQRRQPPQQ